MGDSKLDWISNFIWGIADDVLRDVYGRGKYRDVILPMTVIRRLDTILEPTKDNIRKMKEQLDSSGIVDQDAALCRAAGEAFYNTSKFTLRDLKSRPKLQQLRADFEDYLDGFSPNIQEILEKFKFRNQITTLVEADILGSLIEKFLNARINLSPKPVLDADGKIRLHGLDNHGMGTIFEELIRRFNEENNEEAGEHFTPRDVVKLMADLIFLPVADQIKSGTYLVYDGACGTGGMLTVAEDRLAELARKNGKDVSIHLYGQEVNPEIYAISKADLLLKGEGAEVENMKYGSTLSADAFPSREFDFMLSNPPYGKSWKTDLERMGGKDGVKDPRFIVSLGGNSEYKLMPRSSDGQLLFLVNMISKMKHGSRGGSRIAEVHNGSSLFTGDAGQGESNIRRWIIENDWLEAVIALPLNMFYNTSIATYIWVLSNRKHENRRGKVQLINATEWFRPLRKNLGMKNCELSIEDSRRIVDTLINFEESKYSKIYARETFGHWKVIVHRPLRLKVILTEASISRFRAGCKHKEDFDIADVLDNVAQKLGAGPHLNYNEFLQIMSSETQHRGKKLQAKHKQLLQSTIGEKMPTAEPMIKKIYDAGSIEAEPLYGRYMAEINAKNSVIEYEPDIDLKDSEEIPLLEPGGVPAFFNREVIPYHPDAWIDEDSIEVGYEISFNRYFYELQRLRPLQEIRNDILKLEQETKELLSEIMDRSS